MTGVAGADSADSVVGVDKAEDTGDADDGDAGGADVTVLLGAGIALGTAEVAYNLGPLASFDSGRLD